MDLGAAKTHFVTADLANFVASQCCHGSLPLASAAVFDLQIKKKKKRGSLNYSSVLKNTERQFVGFCT